MSHALHRGLIQLATSARRAQWRLRPGEWTLNDLALLYGADKSSAAHDFAQVYESYLAPWRKRSLTLVEIGVWRGASLRTWRDYFPAGRIVGIDIEPAAAEHAGDRIEVFIGSQADEPFLNSVLERTGPPDLVIDDGSHQAPHQLATLQVMWPHLKPGGLYIVEDTQTSYLPGYDMGWRMPGSTIEILKDFVDDVHHGSHQGPIGLDSIEFVHFYAGTCVLKKRDVVRKQSVAQRLDAASARASGAWTG